MIPHPDFEKLEVPRTLGLGDYHLKMLTAADLEEDFDAVTRSKSVLRGLFGPDWPEGLSLNDNLTDLHWHHREFVARRSFAWVVRDSGGTYLGCAYLFPAIGGQGRAEAAYWMADAPDRLAHLKAFGPLYEAWVAALLPPEFEIIVSSNAAFQDAQ